MNIPTALITGGSSGIGLALSELLIQEGYQVFSISRNPERGLKSPSFIPIKFDLLKVDQIKFFFDQFITQYGLPDILINNAGCGAFYEWEKFPREEIIKQINLLFTAPIIMCRDFAPKMSEAGRGTILNVSSLATLYPLPFMPLYNAGKSALSSFTQSMMIEYSGFPKFIDFRMGDVCTEFNNKAYQQAASSRSVNSSNAWKQIEKQLKNSVSPKIAAKQILKSLKGTKHGTYYGGSNFHSYCLPLFYTVTTSRVLHFLLRKWYSQKVA